MNDVVLHHGDCLEILPTMEAGSVHACVTSPPYYGQRDYGVDGQIGLEETPGEYVAKMVDVFRDVRMVLRDDGTLWLNLGDSYQSGNNPGDSGRKGCNAAVSNTQRECQSRAYAPGVASKQLLGIPWRVAFALQADGWYLRDAIIWAKAENDGEDNEGSAMPGSQRDRCTFAYEMVFLLAKRDRYYFDLDAERTKSGAIPRNVWRINPQAGPGEHYAVMPLELAQRCVRLGTSEKGCCPGCGAPWERVVERVGLREIGVGLDNPLPKKRGRQEMGLASNKSALSCSNSHNASTPQCPIVKTLGWQPTCSCPAAPPIPCTVLDPFSGAGTTGLSVTGLGRRYVGIELNAEYLEMSRRRIERPHAPVKRARKTKETPLFQGL